MSAVPIPLPERPIFRELPPSEWGMLAQMPPFNLYGLPNPQSAAILVGQLPTTGEIVAFGTIFSITHVEPIWIHPDWRKKRGIVKSLWGGLEKILRRAGQRLAFAVVSWEDIPRGNLAQARDLGFERVPGDLYWLRVPEEPRM